MRKPQVDEEQLKNIMLSLAQKDLTEMKLVLAEELPKETIKMIDKLSKIDKAIDKSSITKITNSEFLTFLICLTSNVEYSYSEIKKDCDAVANIVNNWQYAKVHEKMYNLFQDEIRSVNPHSRYYQLGLTDELKKYNIDNIFGILDLFLSLKARINQILKNSQLPPSSKIDRIQRVYKSTTFSTFISNIRQFKEKLKADLAYRQKIARQKIEVINEVIPQIENYQVFAITNIPDNWQVYLHPELLEHLDRLAFRNLNRRKSNLETQKFLLQKYLTRTANKILIDLHLNPQDVPPKLKENITKQASTKNFNNKLNFLLKLGIHPYNIIFQYSFLLPDITDEILTFFTFLLDHGIITKETTISILPTIFSSYKTIHDNYEIIKNYLDFNNPFYNDSILLLPLSEVKNRLSLLKEYSTLPSNILFLLIHIEYLPILDLLLEKDINSIYLISICETENPLNTLKRILIYREIGEEYTNPNGTLKKDIIAENKSLIPSSQINLYIENIVPEVLKYQEDTNYQTISPSEIFSLFKSYEYDANTYLIGETLISKAKFHRQLITHPQFSNIIPSLISGSLLSLSEYVSLRKELSSLTFQNDLLSLTK